MGYTRPTYANFPRQVKSGLIASGSVAFIAGDDLTTEKKTAAITLGTVTDLHPDNQYYIAIDKPTEDTAGNLNVNIYNVDKVDGSNARDVLISTQTVAKITGAATYKGVIVQGLFIGSETSVKLGMSFATDSGAITVYYKIYRI